MDDLDTLKAKLAARKARHGYEENVRQLERQIAELEAQKTSQG